VEGDQFLPTSAPPFPSSRPDLPFAFGGNPRDYFAIWIVNLLLSVVTLGVWSAWAKVRRLPYFYGNTSLDGQAFDYLARPWTILKGRLLVVLALVLYSAAQYAHPLAQQALIVAYLAVLPWAINRALRFNARMTVWRNVRCDFAGSYWGAFAAFVLMTAAAALTISLLAPLAARTAALYVARGHRFGTARFGAAAAAGPFYIAALQALALFAAVALVVALAALVALLAANGGRLPDLDLAAPADPNGFGLTQLLPVAILVVLLVSLRAAAAFFRAKVRNAVVNRLRLEAVGRHRFRSTLSGLRWAWIVASNAIVSLVSLGLLYPWAAVRAWRYQTACLAAVPGGPLDAFIDAQREAGTAVGSESADVLGIEIGF